jgi:hypothetical protein
MKKILLLASLVTCPAALLLTTGCSTTNKQQIVNSVSGDGFYAKAAVPVSSSTSIGLQMFVGRFNNSFILQPTDTNKVYAPSLTLAVAGAGKSGVSGGVGGTGTNAPASAGITDGGRDVSILTTGDAGLSVQSGTNAVLNISGVVK